MSDNKVQQQPAEESWIFTLGSGQQYDGRFVVMPGSPSEAREEMLRRFGRAWSFMYPVAEREQLERYAMVELPREEWPLPVVDRAVNALSAFAVTTEPTAKRLLPSWVHYNAMTADQVERVLDHYRTGRAR